MPTFRSSPTIRGEPPGGIRLPHRLDQLADLLGHGGPAELAVLAQAPPVLPKALLLPGDDGTGLNERQDIFPA
jgi:hypothetical protein